MHLPLEVYPRYSLYVMLCLIVLFFNISVEIQVRFALK